MAGETLFVVLGAGASHSCAAMHSRVLGSEWLRPPLTRELFKPEFQPILGKYPLLQAATPAIREAMGDSAISLEDFLRESYRDATESRRKRVFNAIPIYLRELLFLCSTKFARQPDWYDLLVDHALNRFQTVIFVTLNYDMILDTTLHADHPLIGLNDYVTLTEDKRWALVKLHGSVTWRKRIINEGFSWHDPPDFVEARPEIQHRWPKDLEDLVTWEDSHYSGPGYPALSVPLGPGDRLSCPTEHINFLLDQMRSAGEGLDMVVIGYSGFDEALLQLLEEAGRPIRNLVVVDSERRTAEEVLGRMKEKVDMIGNVEPSPDPFQAVAENGGLRGYLQRMAEQ